MISFLELQEIIGVFKRWKRSPNAKHHMMRAGPICKSLPEDHYARDCWSTMEHFIYVLTSERITLFNPHKTLCSSLFEWEHLTGIYHIQPFTMLRSAFGVHDNAPNLKQVRPISIP